MTIIIYIKKEEAIIVKSRLKELRAREGLNQTELAKLAKISRQTISLIEREEYMPSILIAVRIARIFNESVENVFLIGEDE
ncbi:helix-turn-helix transcriptional regulator [Psychrobacillus sp. Sa2BUA9]|uniref:Helix-turn-helix transcriptional regulator n=1 Tax=Psychrobacillus faecigallinarum TaxID=2762235 RepID=A0ABR8R8I3_9BACI|nr:helix-turn-helix transcriptional regulator [Psychrobacillus faecigallinarum]